jgi:hypothetical protein
MNKAEGGNLLGDSDWWGERRYPLLERRREVLKLLQSSALRSSAALPLEGPDFGGSVRFGQYLPA